ncbi:MAG: tetratricopeptide repeat protein, partial [Pirellulales bacterium]
MKTSRRIERLWVCLFLVALGSATVSAADVPESLRRLEAAAAGCQSAAAAARVYTVALTSGGLQGSDRQAAEARREHWLKLADDGRRRIGREWLDAKERKKLEAEADLFIEQSFEMIRLGNAKLAEDHLKEASRRFPESGRADMILGLVYATVVGDTRRASVHFAEVIKREPRNPYAYNNLALISLRERKYSQGIRQFRQAFEMMPDSQELTDNLAVMLRMVGSGLLIMPEDQVVAVSELYRLAINDLGMQPYQPPQANQQGAGNASFTGGPSAGGGSSMAPRAGGYGSGGLSMAGELGGGEPGATGGYGGGGGYGSGGASPGQPGGNDGAAGTMDFNFFTPFGRPVRGPLALNPATVEMLLDDPDEMVTDVWSGTGVAVADGYVLTTLDVVGDATKVLVRKPDSIGIFLEADV